jgi:hypothetical protein
VEEAKKGRGRGRGCWEIAGEWLQVSIWVLLFNGAEQTSWRRWLIIILSAESDAF